MTRIVLSILLFACLHPAEAFGDAPQGFAVGVGTHYGLRKGDPAQGLPLMQAAGVTSFRDVVLWSDVEDAQGNFSFDGRVARVERAIDLAAQFGLEPLLILCYGHPRYGGGLPVSDEAQAAFARYAERLAARYKGRVRQFEVWNEWNEGMGGRQDVERRAPKHYLSLLRRVYPALKRVDPGIRVLAGAVEGAGSTEWVEEFVRLGGREVMDGLSLHPYVHHRGRGGTPEVAWRWLESLAGKLRAAGQGKPIDLYVTEIGWPVYAGPKGIDAQTAADYLPRILLSMRAIPEVRGVWWYALEDDGLDPRRADDNYGVVTARYERKPAYATLAHAAGLVRGARTVRWVAAPSPVATLAFERQDGTTTLVLWSTDSQSRPVTVGLGEVSQTPPLVSRLAEEGRPGAAAGSPPGAVEASLSLDGRPTVVEIGKPRAPLGRVHIRTR